MAWNGVWGVIGAQQCVGAAAICFQSVSPAEEAGFNMQTNAYTERQRSEPSSWP